MKSLPIMMLYYIFAAVAIICNLLTQRLVLFWGNDAIFYIFAVLTGTFFGLVVKYFLDKNWIFKASIKNKSNNKKQFVFYSLTGVFTTSIFWAFETVFWIMSHSHAMRELGAIIGLVLGYFVKFRLDKSYVFKNV